MSLFLGGGDVMTFEMISVFELFKSRYEMDNLCIL